MLTKETKFDFNDLFIFEMANNHQGSVEHGLRIIREVADIARSFGIRAAVKLQFRDLDSFIHPNFRDTTDNKHIPRFLSTRLTKEQFKVLVDEMHAQGLISMCTPFDEISVDVIRELGIQVLKVASCSSQDWPLLEKISNAGQPVVCSTAGLTLAEVDKVVSFFEHRGVDFALMHCVALYPTLPSKLRLHRIQLFKERYPGVTIGFSTHEDPNNFQAIQMAYAKGARIFEKHIGVTTEDIKLNAYSATPDQIRTWLGHYLEAVQSCNEASATEMDQDEVASLGALARGVYCKVSASRGASLTRDDVYFAMPLQAGQMTSGQWPGTIVLDRDYQEHEFLPALLVHKPLTKREVVSLTIHEVKAMLNKAQISLGYEFSLELSHHYGIERFREIGAVIATCINREYCKKIIIQLPSQIHPMHYHRRKEETFQILYGEVDVRIDNRVRKLYPGDTLLVPRGVFHGFSTETGVILEEVSTTHVKDDSFYADKSINQLGTDARKTQLLHWGIHYFDN